VLHKGTMIANKHNQCRYLRFQLLQIFGRSRRWIEQMEIGREGAEW